SRMLIGPISASVKTRAANSGGFVTCRTLACALWLRTKAISCVPGMTISAMNMPCPWRCLASSLRSKLAPIQLAILSRSCMFRAGTYTFGVYCMRCSRLSTDSSTRQATPAITQFLYPGLPTTPRWSFGGNDFPVFREMLDDLQAGADHMVSHDVIGPLCVRANNSSYDLVVLMKGILRSARNKLKRLKRG